jgi:hypothetical protein
MSKLSTIKEFDETIIEKVKKHINEIDEKARLSLMCHVIIYHNAMTYKKSHIEIINTIITTGPRPILTRYVGDSITNKINSLYNQIIAYERKEKTHDKDGDLYTQEDYNYARFYLQIDNLNKLKDFLETKFTDEIDSEKTHIISFFNKITIHLQNILKTKYMPQVNIVSIDGGYYYKYKKYLYKNK